LWTLEQIFLVVVFVVAGNTPILAFSGRESLAQRKEPTQENLEALRAKKNEEIRTRWLYASPSGWLLFF
jgi:hypothetical protein